MKLKFLIPIFILILISFFLFKNYNDSKPVPGSIPLGDGKVSNEPKTGYVFSCNNRFPDVGGAQKDGSWINNNNTWSPNKKISVQGQVNWTNHKYTITNNEDGLNRTVESNDIPNHTTGVFPVDSSDEAYKYDKNPNSIKQQNIQFQLPTNPILLSKPICLSMGAIGIMNSGVVLFNALDGGGKDAVAHEIQDSCNGHPEREGQYHYHSVSKCLKIDNSNTEPQQVGYALDGFGIYIEPKKDGKPITNEDLDECHGKTSEVLWNNKITNIYHYVATDQYPYTIGCFRANEIKI